MELLLPDFTWPPSKLAVLEWVFRLGMSALVVSRRRPVPVTLAWLVVVLFLPLIGAVLYVFVGESRLGRRRIREYEQITTQVEPLVVARWWERKLTVPRDSAFAPGFDHIAHYANAVGGLPPLLGNRLDVISDTDDFLRRLIRDIDGATSHCHMLYYIWMDGGLAEQVSDALIRAARRGLDCRVLADSVGSKSFVGSRLCERMRAAGVQVLEALPVGALRMLVARLDLRNHRKIAIIDGTVAYTGSQNLTDTSFHFRKRAKVGPWIDASVRVEGPAVQALAMIFLRDWAMETDDPVALDHALFPAASETLVNTPDTSVVQVVPTGPGPDQAAMREALLTTIYAARDELVITTPYFVPDEATMAALTAAARRGVRVVLVMPRNSDSTLVALASRSQYEDLLAAGVHIHLFREGLLHAKIVTADSKLAMIGSANIDMRSFWLNFEVTLFVYHDSVAKRLRDLQLSYIAKSDEVLLFPWRLRPWHRHAVESIARLFGPIL